ncbi:DMT family transporter [Leuconostoc mesenteroides]|uniref:DMT family transporter n=1 Tax=Leuconostoc mesenteroides TaxID=1245 RepID=UPI00308111E2
MIYIALAIGAGLILAAQNAVNAQLSFLLKSPLVACFMAYIVGSFLLLILTVVLGDFSKIELIFSAPIWMTTVVFSDWYSLQVVLFFSQKLGLWKQSCFQH